MVIREKVIEYTHTLKDAKVDKPFKKFPDYEVFRHKSNGKWFGLLMSVEKSKLGLASTDSVEIIDLKLDPEMISILKKGVGYFPAYHMNKNHWITVILDGSIETEQIINLLEESYPLTS